jgi:hypothetical protein
MNHPIPTNVVNPDAGGESDCHANEALMLRTQIMGLFPFFPSIFPSIDLPQIEPLLTS